MAEPNHEQLIIRFLSGNISGPEKKLFLKWLDESTAHKSLFEDMQKLWNLTNVKSAHSDFDTKIEWDKLKSELDKIDATEEIPGENKNVSLYFWKIAASVMLLMVSFFLLYILFLKPQITTVTSNQDKKELILPDGSSVWLNKESELTYTEKGFAETERLVKLKGEAFFEVVKNEKNPFVVQVGDALIKVLGTSFNVKAFDKNKNEVYVVTGKVKFISGENNLVLLPGYKGILDTEKRQLYLIKIDSPNEIAWKTNKLLFKKTPLKDVLQTLEGYYDISFSIKDPELLNCRFTSAFTDPELDEILEALQLALQLEITKNKNNYTVDGKGC